MAQLVRQNRLFAAEDYKAVYESYVNANLQAYDFDTIRSAMIDYVRNHYPENYNDWVESAEFVALMDLIAQFGHNLAFRIDLNSRNNFLSTAERQDAVFKLAEFLGYQPRRNLAAKGELKVISVKTNEPVIGSQGVSLGGQEIRYENTSSVDNLDDFITVMNAVLAPSNQFGSPRKQATINGILTQFYNLNNVIDQITFDITGTVLGVSANYNVIGLRYDSDRKRAIETEPSAINAFSILYKNDGAGISSNNTGFFVGVTQGQLTFKDFVIDNPIDNMSLDVDAENVNESDVWVQTIDGFGNVEKSWKKVDNAFGSSVAYNALAQGERDVFSVKTREDNRISIQFADRMFGNLPRGIVRVWYRTSANDTYVVRPDDIGIKKINVKYTGADGNVYTAVMSVQLKESITNGSSSETLDDIKVNAPRIYATQDRMITAQDYSSYLVRQSDNILKIKSINRTHSGHSRFVDYNDPTGAYTNINLMGTDGIVKGTNVVHKEIVGSITPQRIVDDFFKPVLADPEVLNLYYEQYRNAFNSIRNNYNAAVIEWENVTTLGDITTGFFRSNGSIASVSGLSATYLKHVNIDSMLRFTAPDGSKHWAKVNVISNYGLGVDNNLGQATGKTINGIGAIALDTKIPQGSTLDVIYPSLNRQFTALELSTLVSLLESRAAFSMHYNFLTREWIFSEDDDAFSLPEGPFNEREVSPGSGQFETFDWTATDPYCWMIHANPIDVTNEYEIYVRNKRFTIDSNEVTFSNITGEYFIDEDNKKRARDIITLITYTENNIDYKTTYVKKVDNEGKLVLILEDKGADNRPDNPDALYEIMGSNMELMAQRFEWTHVPAVNELIDPSFTNIIDVFALTRTYDTAYRRYLSDATGNVTEPVPPTIDELNQQFAQVNNKKAMSDKIIYRPVKYKVLFGDKADTTLQGRIRVVKVPNSAVTDNEVKNRVVIAINEFFDLKNWDFGETFYFTELAAYVHKQMAGVVSSLVIVPEGAGSVFGDLFQITPASDEIFIPDVDTSTIDIIDSINNATIRTA